MAKLCGVSVRTLRYYDQTGLVKPTKVSPSGYRFYDESALQTLQEVLFYRELELPLSQIAALLHEPRRDRAQLLADHKKLLLLKREKLDGLLRLLDDIEQSGGTPMKEHRTTLSTLCAAQEQFQEEAKARYGGTKQWAQFEQKNPSGTPSFAANEEADEIFSAFAALAKAHASPGGKEALALARRWQAHITARYYDCTDEILCSLAQMYVADPRFFQSLERYGEGTARMMHDAILALCAPKAE